MKKISTLLFLAALFTSCNQDRNVVSSDAIESEDSGLTIRGAVLKKSGDLVVYSNEEQPIAHLRGIVSFETIPTNLLTKDRFGLTTYYDNDCNFLFALEDIRFAHLSQLGFAALNNDNEFTLFDRHGETILSENDVTNFELDNNSLIVTKKDRQKLFLAIDGETRVDINNTVKFALAGKGIVFLTRLGTLTYISSTGEILEEISDVNHFYVEEINHHVTYQVRSDYRKIKHFEL